VPQYSSHTRLLVACQPGRRRRRIDAVLVPTVRPVELLTFAIGLARDLGCPVLLLCSSASQGRAATAVLDDVTGASVVVPALVDHPMLELPSLRPCTWRSQPYVDTANKRNISLLVARALGWRRVLFLDDDITGLTAQEVTRTAALMRGGRLPVIGWRYPRFPDNSVACHARRSSGEAQDVFLGAGALLVDVADDVPFFPAVYNDDWLFWHDVTVAGQLGWAGDVQQRPFNPFEDVNRAHRQEFGDVLAEGLFSLIHAGQPVLAACSPVYWGRVIQERRDMLSDTEERLSKLPGTHTPDGYEIHQVMKAVTECRQALGMFGEDDLARYTSQWRFDLSRWRARLHEVPRYDRVADALGWLGIADVHVVGGV
jgi:hypothetical protein